MEVKNEKMGAGRTMMMCGGMPVAVAVVVRESTSVPSRYKAALVVATEDGNGYVGIAPLPFATPMIPTKPGRRPSGFTPEWRLEMN